MSVRCNRFTAWFRAPLAAAALVTAVVVPACGGTPAPATSAAPAPATPATSKPKGEAEGYVIRFHRPVAVGYRYTFSHRGERRRTITVAGKPAPGIRSLVHEYAATVTVTAVDGEGRPTAEKHEITRFEATIDGQRKTVLKAGQVVTVKLEGDKEHYQVDGGAPDKLTAELLGEIVEVAHDLDADKIFGGATRRKVGDSWQPHKRRLAASFNAKLKDAPLPLKVENITGLVTLVGTKDVAGTKMLELKVDLDLRDVAPKMSPVKVTAGTIRLELRGWVPADPASTSGETKSDLAVMHFEGEIGGKPVVADMRQSSKKTRTAIK